MTARDRTFFELLDENDELAGFREEFDLPDGLVFLNGNSLGAPPKSTWHRLSRVVRQEWRHDMNAAWWTHGWLDLPTAVGDRIGQLIGAAPGQVVVGESTSVNLFKLLCGALRVHAGSGRERQTILTDTNNFPSDLYIADGITQHVHPAARVRRVDIESIPDALDDDVAVVMLSHVDYRTGKILPMSEINKRAHAVGSLVLWDLSHSVGVVPLALDADDADLAVGCGYKYLNGGPGAPGYMYVSARLLPDMQQPITGWLGHADPFAFEADYRPAPGIGRLTTGCPPLLSLAALDEGISLTAKADPVLVRAKSSALTELFIELASERLTPYGADVLSPRAQAQRGGHVTLRHRAARGLIERLGTEGFMAELRVPNLLRIGLSPLFVRFVDVWDSVAALERILAGALEDTAGDQQ
ncbi:kynureninase [Streptomyces sp. NPDC002838]|uniref:kynureninase n=1 Tax=Streptomyces sp. NPDC002838 TaxID=3154436 RepID=UPI003322E43E